MSESSPVQPSLPLSLLAGALVLLALPLGLTAFALSAQNVGRAWNEGGYGMWLVLVATVLASMTSSVLLAVASRRRFELAAFLPFVLVLPASCGNFLNHDSLQASVSAVEDAAPADRAVILFGSVSEASQLSNFGALMTFGVALGVALGLAVAASARPRGALAVARPMFTVGALVAASLALVTWLGADAVRLWSAAYRSVAHERFTDQLPSLVEQAQAASTVFKLATALCFGFAGVGAFVVRSSGRRRATTLGFLGAFSVAAVALASGPSVSSKTVRAISAAQATVPLLDFDGPREHARGDFTLGREVPSEAFPNQVQSFLRFRGEDTTPLALELSQDVSSTSLVTALTVLAQEGVGAVNLLLDHDDGTKPTLPPPFDAFDHTLVVVGLSLEQSSLVEPCAVTRCASLSSEALIVEGEPWPLVHGRKVSVSPEAPALPMLLTAADPLVLVRAAMTAAEHQRRLTLVLPGSPEPEPVPAPVGVSTVKVDLGSVSTIGKLDQRRVVSELRDQIAALGRCVSEDEGSVATPLSVQLELGVNSEGSVTMAEANGLRDHSLGSCLSRAAEGFEFSAPGIRGMSLVEARVTLRPR